MKKNYFAVLLLIITSVALIGGSVLAPLSVEAKEKNKDKNKKSATAEVVLAVAGTDGGIQTTSISKNKQKNSNATLVQAIKGVESETSPVTVPRGLLKQLIAFLQSLGFIVLPPGTTPPPSSNDTAAPVIRAAHADHITSNSAEIFWETNEPTNSRVFWATTTPIQIDPSTPSAFDDEFVRTHRITLTGLAPNTAYHYRVASADQSGNTTHSGELAFSTKPATPVSDTTAPQITAVATRAIGTSSAEVVWTTDENANSSVIYGTTTPLNISAPSSLVAHKSTHEKAHLIKLALLAQNTTYYYRVSSADEAGNITIHPQEFSFKTQAVPVADTTAPLLLSVTASQIASTTARVRWTTDEAATGSVWYGTTTPVTMAAPFIEIGTSTLGTAHDFILPNLFASTTYYYLVSSSDAAGNTSASSESSFSTLIQ